MSILNKYSIFFSKSAFKIFIIILCLFINFSVPQLIVQGKWIELNDFFINYSYTLHTLVIYSIKTYVTQNVLYDDKCFKMKNKTYSRWKLIFFFKVTIIKKVLGETNCKILRILNSTAAII